MTAREVAARFRGRGPARGPWRARCPVHKSRSLTLAIYADKDRASVHCHAGCTQDEVLASVGLTWKDMYYQPWVKPDPKAEAERRRKEAEQEARESALRIGVWVLRFAADGYTVEDRDSDMTVIAACAIVLSQPSPPKHWERIFRTHMERIAAADHCRDRKMLPPIAKPRKDFP